MRPVLCGAGILSEHDDPGCKSLAVYLWFTLGTLWIQQKNPQSEFHSVGVPNQSLLCWVLGAGWLALLAWVLGCLLCLREMLGWSPGEFRSHVGPCSSRPSFNSCEFMVRTVRVDNFSTNGITMETIENIVSFCPTSPMMRHNQIAVANRRLNVPWRRMFRAVLRVLLPANISLSALSTDDLRDVLGFDDG